LSAKFQELKEWYESHESPISALSLLFGFVFDSLTLQRIDALGDNLWLATNLVLVGLIIALLNRQEVLASATSGSPRQEAVESGRHFWLFNFLQFGIGNILGGFFILYFRSGTIATSWPFMLLLLAALVSNELYLKRYPRLVFQAAFFYLALFSFLIYLVPIFLHSIGRGIFLLSGVASLILFWLFAKTLRKFIGKKFRKSERPLWAAVGVIFVSVNLLYFANLIPPIPLSLKDAGIYQYLSHDSRGGYVLGEEERKLTDYLSFYRTVRLAPGDPLYVYSAIFSPAELDTRIIHEWQYRDEETGEWMVATRIPLLLSGGRAEGFRTYSVKENVAAGLWRVNIETPRGQILGRLNFRVVHADSRPALRYEVKN